MEVGRILLRHTSDYTECLDTPIAVCVIRQIASTPYEQNRQSISQTNYLHTMTTR